MADINVRRLKGKPPKVRYQAAGGAYTLAGTTRYRMGRYEMEFTIADIMALCAAGLVLVGAIALAIVEWPKEERR